MRRGEQRSFLRDQSNMLKVKSRKPISRQERENALYPVVYYIYMYIFLIFKTKKSEDISGSPTGVRVDWSPNKNSVRITEIRTTIVRLGLTPGWSEFLFFAEWDCSPDSFGPNGTVEVVVVDLFAPPSTSTRNIRNRLQFEFLSEFEVKIGSISGGVNQEPRWVRLARPVYLSADAVLKKIIEIRLRAAARRIFPRVDD